MGYGTALGIVRSAIEQGKKIRVVATETRPRLQGARLTTFELKRDNIPVTLITDSMAAMTMRSEVDKVVVGADRILRTGHVFNKIGTYGLAVLARYHKIPCYFAAPTSTFDLCASVEDVEIEHRNPEEVTVLGRSRIAPWGVEVLNPAFDRTPPGLVTAIVTELGIVWPPFEETIPKIVKSGLSVRD